MVRIKRAYTKGVEVSRINGFAVSDTQILTELSLVVTPTMLLSEETVQGVVLSRSYYPPMEERSKASFMLPQLSHNHLQPC
jgi:hypothetical protein